MTDYCERDLVKNRLEGIEATDDDYDDKIDACIAEASAIIDNKLEQYDGVPQPVPAIIQHAAADIAAASFKETLDPTAEQLLHQKGLDKINQYIEALKVTEIPFVVAEDTS